MSEFTSYRGRGRGRPPWNAHVPSGQESPADSQESEEERPPAGPPHAMGFYPGHHGFPHPPPDMHQMYPPFYPPQHLPMMVPNPMAQSYPPYVFMYPQGQQHPPQNPTAPEPNPEISETELASTDHTPPLPAPELELKEEKPLPPKKKLLVFKDPKTGKELDLSKDVIRAPPKVEEPKVVIPESPVSPASPASPKHDEEEEEQRPVKKQLKGLKNAPLPPKPSDESKLASKRIFNKPLVKTAPAFVPAVPVYTWPLSRDTILLLMPKHRPPRELFPEEVIPLGVIYPKKTAAPSNRGGRGAAQPAEWRGQQNSRSRPVPKRPTVHVAPLATSENAYKVLQASQLDEKERLKRQVMSQLNKITLDSCDVITSKISDISITEPWQLDLIVGSVFDKAVIEHHYSEMYADMCIQLRNRWPELPYTFINEETGESNTIAITFARTLIEKCQNEFDAIPASLEPTEEERERLKNDSADLEILRSKKKEKILGNMKFIAQLYLRQLLSTNVISSVVNQLLSEEFPEEHYIECVCMFLQNVGAHLEIRAKGLTLLDAFFDQLRGLVESEQYPKRIQFMILNLFDVRSGGWKNSRAMGKLQSAKTKDEVRREQNVKAAPVRATQSFYRQPLPVKPRFNAANVPAIQSRTTPILTQSRVVDEDPSSSSDTASSGTEAPPALQAASFSSDELTAEMKGLIKKFRVYFHEDRNLESFVESLEAKDLKSWAPVAHCLLDIGVQDPKRFTGDAELLVALVTVAKRISWIDLSAAYCGFCEDLPDLAVDVPMAPAFLNEVVARFIVANQEATIEHLIAPAWSTVESHDVVKYASGVIEAVKHFFGESQMHAATSALKPRLSEWLSEAELARVLNVEEEGTGADEEIDEMVRTGDFKNPKLLTLVAAKRKSKEFVTRRVELVVRNNKQPWSTVPWEDRLAASHVYLKALLRPGVGDDEEVEAIRQFCKVMLFTEFKPADVSSVAVAFVKLGLFSFAALKHFIANTLDASAEKLAALDGLNRAVKSLEE